MGNEPRPVPLKVRAENIPAELKAIPRWVEWKYDVVHDGRGARAPTRWTKVPYQTSGQKASVSDPATWTTFEAALAAYENGDRFAGLGLVLDGSDDLVAWDLDHCLDRNTQQLNADAREALALDSYAEVTPSGEGLRILARATLPVDGRRKGYVEVYQRGRYVTITGNRWPGAPAEIARRDDENARLFQRFFGDGPLFQSGRDAGARPTAPGKELILFEGRWEAAGYPSQSEADLALCSILARASRKPGFIDAAFRRSGLAREKWDERHGAQTYGEMTIAKALGAAKADLVVVAADEFARRKFAAREYLLRPLIQAKTLAMIHGWRGVGKTFVALGSALGVAAGGTFLGWEAPVARAVLYVDGELPQETLQKRLCDLARSTQLAVPAGLRLLTPDMQPRPIPDLAEPEGQAGLDEVIERENPALIVLDNLSTLMRSGKENEAESWQRAQDWLVSLRSRGRSVVLVHHSGKSGAQRGTSKREDVLDVVVKLERPHDYRPEEGARFEVHFEKARDEHGAPVAAFEARLEGDTWTRQGLERGKEDRIRALLEDGMEPREVARETRASPSYVHRVRKKMSRENTSRGGLL